LKKKAAKKQHKAAKYAAEQADFDSVLKQIESTEGDEDSPVSVNSLVEKIGHVVDGERLSQDLAPGQLGRAS